METTRRSQPWAADSAFQMIDVSSKAPTQRRAVARGTIHLAPDAFSALREGTNPKGDVLKLAEVAGIQAAKRTADLLPLCHPLSLESVRLSFECDSQNYSVTVYCECALTGKTGVEMEALAGVNGALLAIYDLSKAVNPVLSMTDIRLELKEGGKQGRWLHPKAEMPVPQPQPKPPRERALAGIFAATLTISDRCSKNETQDRSGPLLVDELTQRGAEVIGHAIVADEPDEIRKSVIRFVREQGAKLVITTGGTGLGPRDNTPEAVAPLWSRRLPGFGELLRAHGAKQTEMSWLSRSEAGLVGQSLVILLPGSPRAVQDAMKALEHLIPHALSIAQGGAH